MSALSISLDLYYCSLHNYSKCFKNHQTQNTQTKFMKSYRKFKIIWTIYSTIFRIFLQVYAAQKLQQRPNCTKAGQFTSKIHNLHL